MTEGASLTIMFLTLGVGYFFIFYFIWAVIVSFKVAVRKYQATQISRKIYREYTDRHQKMREAGELHDYVSIPSGLFDGDGYPINRLVCKKSYWCPEINDYLTKEFVERQLVYKKNEEEFAEFRALTIKQISEDSGVEEVEIDAILNDYFEAKKQYHVNKMKKAVEDIKKELGKNG